MFTEQIEQKRAVVYLRAAHPQQPNREQAIVVQQHVCQQRADELGAQVVCEYIEYGPGTTLDQRPALRTLLDALKRKPCDYVIVYDHACTARNMEAYTNIVWLIEKSGARLEVASLPHVEAQDSGSLDAFMEGIGWRQHEETKRAGETNFGEES